ncbi:MAG: hypothetical protein IAI48_18075 [Candidatus Eremiobacteraeota bacterium]|nr:hypothetical protein [Candidatus Eremiobacteraeota bacterium]
MTTLTCTLASAVGSGDQTLVVVGSKAPASTPNGYRSIGTVTNGTSTFTVYDASPGLSAVTLTFASASDAHVVVLDVANGGTPTGFTSAKSATAPAITASANAIVLDAFGEKYGFAFDGDAVPSGWTDYYPPGSKGAGNGLNQIDVLAHPSSVAGSSYHLTDETYVISASFEIAAGTATASPTSKPTASPPASAKPTASPAPSPMTSGAYDSRTGHTPAGGSFGYFPSSPYRKTLPNTPALVSSSQSAAWNAMQASDDFSSITISEDGTNGNDGSDPTTYTNGDGTGYKLDCDKYSYSHYSCNSTANVRSLSGATVKIPLGAITAGDSDHHIVNIDVVAGIEDDIWEGRPIPSSSGATWAVGGGGECALSGSGSGCGGAVATNIAATLGLVRAEDILYCLEGSSSPSSCTLPYAVSIALACNGSGVEYPATASDAQCGGGQGTSSTRIAEGTRGCLNMTDAEINATSYRDDEKVVYRTMDCAHYGVFDRDSAYDEGPGISIQYQGGEAYAAFSQTDPWKTLAARVGIAKQNRADYIFPYTLTKPKFVWCANTKKDGLCD